MERLSPSGGGNEMTYACGRPMLDADSHLMELPGFLDPFIERDMRDRLKGREMSRLASRLDAAVAAAERRRTNPQQRADAEERLLQDKGWNAMGAFDPAERSQVLDLFGFDGPARVRHLRDGDVHGARRGPALRRQRGPQPRGRRLLRGRSPAAARRVRARSSIPIRAVAALREAIELGSRRDPRAVDRGRRRARRPIPTSTRSGSCSNDSGVPVRAARRRRRPPARPRLPQQRHAGDRPPRRWREHPLEGLPRDRQLAVACSWAR